MKIFSDINPLLKHRLLLVLKRWDWLEPRKSLSLLPQKALGLIIFKYNPANIFSCLVALSDTICDAQSAETEQVAVSLKMTIIKVTMKMDLVILRF